MAHIEMRHCDVGEQRSPYGSQAFSQERVVSDIKPVEGGEKGLITYKGLSVPVYRKKDSSRWETNPNALKPVRGYYLNKGGL